jgi:hypothetical protein
MPKWQLEFQAEKVFICIRAFATFCLLAIWVDLCKNGPKAPQFFVITEASTMRA